MDAVIHIAAKKQVGESTERPAWYYQQNVGGMAHLLQAMQNARVDKLMFSSSAATYGSPGLPPGELIKRRVVLKLSGEALAASNGWGVEAPRNWA